MSFVNWTKSALTWARGLHEGLSGLGRPVSVPLRMLLVGPIEMGTST